MIITESKSIKESIDALSVEEFDSVLYDCGIESIKPSVKSQYVKCLNVSVKSDYQKNIPQYFLQEDYYEIRRNENERKGNEAA